VRDTGKVLCPDAVDSIEVTRVMRCCESTDVMQNSGTAVLRPDVVEELEGTRDVHRREELKDVVRDTGTAVLLPDVIEALGTTSNMRRWDESNDAMRDTGTALLHPDIVKAFGIICDMRASESLLVSALW